MSFVSNLYQRWSVLPLVLGCLVLASGLPDLDQGLLTASFLQNIKMSAPTPSDETYPGRDYPLSQLLYAVKKNLHHAAFGGRSV